MNKGILSMYSLAVTCCLVVSLLRAQNQPRPATFDTITVHRINVVDPQGTQRVWVGRDNAGAASVVLKDAAGMKRIALEVQPDGNASLAFFDNAGKVVWKLVPTAH
jgi:hypothetical protein